MYGLDPVEFLYTETGTLLANVRGAVVDVSRVKHVFEIDCERRPLPWCSMELRLLL